MTQALTVKDIINDTFQASTLSQMLVVTRIRELFEEQKKLHAQLKEIQQRLEVIPFVGAELLQLLDDMPDENQNRPNNEEVS